MAAAGPVWWAILQINKVSANARLIRWPIAGARSDGTAWPPAWGQGRGPNRGWLRIRPKITHKPMSRSDQRASGKVGLCGQRQAVLYPIDNTRFSSNRRRSHFWTAGGLPLASAQPPVSLVVDPKYQGIVVTSDCVTRISCGRFWVVSSTDPWCCALCCGIRFSQKATNEPHKRKLDLFSNDPNASRLFSYLTPRPAK